MSAVLDRIGAQLPALAGSHEQQTIARCYRACRHIEAGTVHARMRRCHVDVYSVALAAVLGASWPGTAEHTLAAALKAWLAGRHRYAGALLTGMERRQAQAAVA